MVIGKKEKKDKKTWLYKNADEGSIFIVGSEEYKKAIKNGWVGDLAKIKTVQETVENETMEEVESKDNEPSF